MRNKTKDIILSGISVLLMFIGCLYGVHHDWIIYILVIPFGWIVIGALLDTLVNGKYSNRESVVNAMLCAANVANVALILYDNAFDFVLGRLIFCTGSCLMIIRITTDYKVPKSIIPDNTTEQ